MKKSKIMIALVLAAVIVIACITVPTFSWFERPQTQSGNAFGFGEGSDEYTAYNGKGVTIATTLKTSDDGVTFTVPVSNFNGSNVSAYGRNYYCTTIHNSSSTEQNVSLYASTLTSNIAQFALGVNGPTRTYRDYTLLSAGTSTKTNGDTMRVYFKRPTNNYVNGVNWHTGTYWIHWWVVGSSDPNDVGWVSMTDTGDNNNYYGDVPARATKIYFYTNSTETGSNRTEDVNVAECNQSQTDCQIFIAYNDTIGDYSHVKVGGHNHIDGANFVEWYNTVNVVMGSFYDASVSYPQVLGNVSYSSSDTSVFTVDSKGKITTVGLGQATLTTTATGQSYSDTITKTTTVTVSATGSQEYHDVPIVKNIKVPACTTPGESHSATDDPPCEVKIYWYVVNNSTTNTALTYTIDYLYLGL